LAYAALVAYSSLVVGPLGWHFVPLDPGEAWRAFLATPLLENGSDQRPDWIANLLLLIPLGFLATGALAVSRAVVWSIAGTILALILSLAFVLAVKYGQLFFPPRTVSLNYIIAQSLGVAFGVALFHLARVTTPMLAAQDDQARLRHLLDIAVVIAVAFALFPFDLVLSADDLHDRLNALPGVLRQWPGAGRSPGMRLVLTAMTAATTVPLGMRLALRRDRPGMARIAAVGTIWMLVLLLAGMLMLSATPSLPTTACRVVGIVVGSCALRWLASLDMARVRLALARLVPLLLPVYLLLLAYVQDLFQPDWLTPEQALAQLETRALIPLFSHYIVGKAHAVAGIVVHAAMYAPVGLMVWLRCGDGRRNAWAAGILAGVLALTVELARAFQPGRGPDVDGIIVAAFASALVARLSPVVWRLLCSVSAVPTQPGPAVGRVQRSSAGAAQLARAQRAAFEQIAGNRRFTVVAVPIPVSVRAVLAMCCAVGAVILAARYPLGPWYAGIGIAVWAGLLCWRPALWLVLLPAVLPSVDLAPWTGWMVTSEADMAVLATLGVLLLRDPPSRTDLWPTGAAGAALVLATLACLVGLARGLMLPTVMVGGSDNPYLEPLSALRLAKSFIEVLALMPFLLARHRAHGDAVARFGCGMAIGLCAVGIAAAAERAAFVGVFDVHSDYRVVATFSSMHIGGGHIGAFMALALPFLFVFLSRPTVWTLLALPVAGLLGAYTLVVTFARTAYAAALGAMVTTSASWAIAQFRQGRRAAAVVGAVLPILILAVVMIGILTPYMTARLGQTETDFFTRENAWAGGLAMEREDWLSLMLGMGTGTFPRVAAADAPAATTVGNYVVASDGGHSHLTLRSGPEFYFGQKVNVVPATNYTLGLDVRANAPDVALEVGLCAKLLLYSLDCHAASFAPGSVGSWHRVTASLRSPDTTGPLPAPVELWLATNSSEPLDVRAVRLVGPDGTDVVANGDFASGTARWFFTSDRHLSWRIKNLYLATWFDGGVLGLVALVIVYATAIAGAARAVGRGDRWGAPVIGGLVALLISGLFDNVLEAPRLAFLYDMLLVLGLVLGMRPGWPRRDKPRAQRVMATTAV
jgi:VanZ family protein